MAKLNTSRSGVRRSFIKENYIAQKREKERDREGEVNGEYESECGLDCLVCRDRFQI